MYTTGSYDTNVQVCWCVLAITVAVRVDVYGVFYALALGLILLVPRRFLFPVWVVYLILHGALLIVQYFFLMGIPSGYCLTRTGEGDSTCCLFVICIYGMGGSFKNCFLV